MEGPLLRWTITLRNIDVPPRSETFYQTDKQYATTTMSGPGFQATITLLSVGSILSTLQAIATHALTNATIECAGISAHSTKLFAVLSKSLYPLWHGTVYNLHE